MTQTAGVRAAGEPQVMSARMSSSVSLCLPKISSAQVGGAIWFRRELNELVAPPGSAHYGMMIGVLLRLTYLSVTNVFALLRLLPVSDQDKEAETLAPRHQIMVFAASAGHEPAAVHSR